MDLSLDSGDLEAVQRNDLLVVIKVKASHYGLTIVPLPDDEFDMGVGTSQVLEVVVEVRPCVCRRRPVL